MEKYQRQVAILTQSLRTVQTEYQSKKRELDVYEMEVSRAILGESQWAPNLLQKMISKTQMAMTAAEQQIQRLQKQLDDCETLSDRVRKEYAQVVSWSKLYSTSSMEARKMIAAQLIRQVRVYKNYRRIEIDFNISKDFETISIQEADVVRHRSIHC